MENEVMNFLRMQKEYFRYRGELQNDTITGVNVDEKTACKDFLNKAQRRLVDLHPNYFATEFDVRLINDVLNINIGF
jgi:hypothetical protein